MQCFIYSVCFSLKLMLLSMLITNCEMCIMDSNWGPITLLIICSLEGLMLKLKLQYFGRLMRRADSLKRLWCWERLKAEGEEAIRGWDGWIASLMQWTWTLTNSRRWWRTGRPAVLQSIGTWLDDSTTAGLIKFSCVGFKASDLLLKLLWAAPGVSSDVAIYHCVLSESSMEKKTNKSSLSPMFFLSA